MIDPEEKLEYLKEYMDMYVEQITFQYKTLQDFFLIMKLGILPLSNQPFIPYFSFEDYIKTKI